MIKPPPEVYLALFRNEVKPAADGGAGRDPRDVWATQAGALVRNGYVGRSEAVAEANQVLFFNRGEGYQISHPVAGGDACLSMVVAEPVRAELAPQKANELRRRIKSHRLAVNQGGAKSGRIIALQPG